MNDVSLKPRGSHVLLQRLFSSKKVWWIFAIDFVTKMHNKQGIWGMQKNAIFRSSWARKVIVLMRQNTCAASTTRILLCDLILQAILFGLTVLMLLLFACFKSHFVWTYEVCSCSVGSQFPSSSSEVASRGNSGMKTEEDWVGGLLPAYFLPPRFSTSRSESMGFKTKQSNALRGYQGIYLSSYSQIPILSRFWWDRVDRFVVVLHSPHSTKTK